MRTVEENIKYCKNLKIKINAEAKNIVTEEMVNMNKDFNENHLSLYYALGGKQILRDYTSLLYLFQSVIMSVAQLTKQNT